MTDNELLQAIYKDTQELKSRLNSIENNVTDHLSRKLDGALKVENEKEMLLIRVNRLENEIRQIKEKINVIA